MNTCRIYARGTWALQLLLLVALLCASFSHTAFAQKIVTPDGFDQRAYAAQFTLPDGTLPVLCDWTGDGKPHHSSAVPCAFCHISTNALLANYEPSIFSIEFPSARITFGSLRENKRSDGINNFLPPSRGPPLA